MKKSKMFFLLAVVTCSIVLSSFVIKNYTTKAYDPKYYVAMGKENYGGGKLASFAITNVVYLDCDHEHTTTTVTNQLYTYYKAFHQKSRGSISFGGRGDISAFSFDSRSAAEKQRRELIAKFGQNNDVLLIEKFSVLCDD